MDNEKLGGCAVRIVGSCHGDYAPHMGNLIFHAVFGKFAFDRFVRTAGSIPLRVSALDHKTADDPVEGEAVIETVLGKPDKIGDADRCGIRIQLQGNGAVILHFDFNMVQPFQIGFFFRRGVLLLLRILCIACVRTFCTVGVCTFRFTCLRLRGIIPFRTASGEDGGKEGDAQEASKYFLVLVKKSVGNFLNQQQLPITDIFYAVPIAFLSDCAQG